RAPGRSVPPGSARPLPTAPGGHPVRQSSAAGSTPCGRLAALATPHARTPTAAANVLPADWAHGLRPPRRTDTSLAASWPGLLASRGTLVCLRAAITVCAETCHASSGPHRPLLRYDCSTARSTSRALTPSLTRWWGVTPMTASARYAYCLPARWRKYVRS